MGDKQLHGWAYEFSFSFLESLEGIGCPLAFWRRDELLMRRAKDEGLVSYNLITTVSTPMSPVDLAHTYLNSLIWVHGSN